MKWRAGYTLSVLDRVLDKPNLARAAARVCCRGSAGMPGDAVIAELVFDPPGHVRLPIADDEIVDRVLAVQPLAGREVTLLTFDTGQYTRARAAGLRAAKLSKPIRDEPA